LAHPESRAHYDCKRHEWKHHAQGLITLAETVTFWLDQ
jgi:hypothetical protein